MNLVGRSRMRIATQRSQEFCALAQSPSAAIRWRFMDYEQLLTKQLKLLAGPEFSSPQTRFKSGLNGWSNT
jgi:hypothetical protein